jgi:hypothetical protein
MLTQANLRSYCLLLFLAGHALAIVKSPHLYTPTPQGNLTAQTEYWFESQVLDHFNPADNRTFAQRYWINSTFYDQKLGRILLYICPEMACQGIPDYYFMNVAQTTRALVVTLEHRYYGLSVPFGNQSLTVENLGYLSVEQALADYAYFAQWFNQNNEFAINASPAWVCVGGSYAGGLSSWLRETYPNVFVGSWASSAVINAITDFTMFDYQVYLSTSKSGPACPLAIQNLTAYIESNLYDN